MRNKFLKIVSNLLKFVIKKLKNINSKINIIINHLNKDPYEDLTPKCDIDEDEKYSKVLKWALENQNIKNIALTGSYGSGKSSILKTFEKNNKKYRYLNISLASFKNEETDNKETKIDIDNEIIEKSILQQMFYKVKSNKIPYSRFKRIKNLNKKDFIVSFILLIIWFFTLILLFAPKLIDYAKNNIQILKKLNNSNLDNNLFIGIITLIFVLTTIKIIGTIFKYLKKINLSKISFKSGEIELGTDSSDISIFNKHLDEFLYFFEVTKYNVVIFEDLDRFDNTDIFTKLRELNSLINNCEQIGRRIVFIYAIKDDMFTDKNRTKFFDFMIPVIPIINSSNSCDILLQKVKESNLKTDLSEEFISDIALYIDEMRLLKNIYNEFLIYKDKLSRIDLNLIKLFSMIVYKNIYPSDFEDLHFNKGMVYQSFKNKEELISEIERKKSKIQIEINKEREKVKKEYITSLKELRSIYIGALMERIPQATNIQIDNNNYLISKFITDESLFNKLRTQYEINYYTSSNYYRTSISFQSIENTVDSNISFDERAKIIKEKQEGEIEELKKQLEDLNNRKNEVKSRSLKNFINNENINVIFDEDTRKEKLLVFLVRNGYIDEMYHNYISYFYPGSITQEDMDFVMSVKNHEALDYNYKLVNTNNNIEKIIKKLHSDEFKQKEILNCDLINYIIENINDYKDYFEIIINQLSDNNKISTDFIDLYRKITINEEFFIKYLCNKWTNIWKFVDLESDYTINKKDEYLVSIIKFADMKDIINIDNNDILANYISKTENFIDLFLDTKYYAKIKEIITELNIVFDYVYSPQNDLFRFIYQNNFYKINERMIEAIIKEEYQNNLDILNNLKKSNHTTIKQSKCEYLIKYIDTNIKEYINNVFLKLSDNNEESEETMISLLNNEEIPLENKESMIDKQKVQITDITKIDEILWQKIIKSLKIKTNWFNLINYFQKIGKIDENLIFYLNNDTNYKELSKNKFDKNIGFEENIIKKFNLALIECELISKESFKYIVKSFPYRWNSLNIKELSQNRIDDILNYNLLVLTNDNLIFLKEKTKNKHILLIERNIDLFFEEIYLFNLDSNDISLLLESKVLKEEQKLTIIKYVKTNLIDDKLLELIYKILLDDTTNIELNIDLLTKLLNDSKSLDDKIKLFSNKLKYLKDENITHFFNEFGEPYSHLTEKGKNLIIEKSDINNQLLLKLKEKGYISSFKEEDKKIRVYTKKIET